MKAVYISATIFVNEDLDQEQIDDVISEMDYSFNHPRIGDTRINGQIDSDNAF
jgi:hypothetical protein